MSLAPKKHWSLYLCVVDWKSNAVIVTDLHLFPLMDESIDSLGYATAFQPSTRMAIIVRSRCKNLTEAKQHLSPAMDFIDLQVSLSYRGVPPVRYKVRWKSFRLRSSGITLSSMWATWSPFRSSLLNLSMTLNLYWQFLETLMEPWNSNIVS